MTSRTKPTFLEFFAGSGLVNEGLKSQFRVVWANDNCPKKGATYIANHGKKHFHLGSISDVKGEELPAADLAWASFPCQDLSLAGNAEGIHASRSGLVWEWLRVIDEMPASPPVLVAENVAGLVSAKSGAHYQLLHKALTDRGYAVGAMILDAIHWVPQSRPRVFIVAAKKIPDRLTDTQANWLHPASVVRAANGLTDWIWWKMPAPAPRQQSLLDVVELDAPLAPAATNQRNIDLISPKHREVLDTLPKSEIFAAPGYKRTRNGRQVLELRFDSVAGCLRTPEGGSSRQVLVIKRQGKLSSRLLTVRETARLMGAPDTYKLVGSYNDGYKAMGDAVAVPVAAWLSKYLLAPLLKANG